MSQIRNTVMVQVNAYSAVPSEIHAKQKRLLKILAHNECVFKLFIINLYVNHYYSNRDVKLMPSACPIHNCISTICTLSDISLYNGKEIQE